MIILSFYLFVIAYQASAQEDCSQYLARNSFSVTPYAEKMHRLMQSDGGKDIGEIVSARAPLVRSREWRVDMNNVAWAPPASLIGILPVPFKPLYRRESAVKSEDFYKSAYGHYQKFSDELINILRAVDSGLESENIFWGEVHTRNDTVGTWRWYVIDPFNLSKESGRLPAFPFARLNQERNIGKLDISDSIDHFLDLGNRVIEIGKFAVESEDSNVGLRATKLIEMAWLRLAHDDDVFIAHVATKAHARLYRKYGFEVAEAFVVNETDSDEMILWVRGWQFKQAILKLLSVAPPQSIDPVPSQPALLPSES